MRKFRLLLFIPLSGLLLAACSANGPSSSLPKSTLTKAQVLTVSKIDLQTYGKLSKVQFGSFQYLASKPFARRSTHWPRAVWVGSLTGQMALPQSCPPKAPCLATIKNVTGTIFINPQNGSLIELLIPGIKVK